MYIRLVLVATVLMTAVSAASFRNPGIDEFDKNSETIAGWYTPKNAGWTQPKYSDSNCHSGPGCGYMPLGSGERSNLMQYFDAAPYRGKLVRMRGWIRTQGSGRAQMWLRVDLPDKKMGFFDNMGDRPVAGQTEWRAVEISGTVASDAVGIALGAMAFDGPVWFDEVTFDIVGNPPKPGPIEPARPISELGVRNLTTFAELYGVIRYYHPSDEVAAANMDHLALEALPAVETADTPEKLAQALRSAFGPVAPTVRIWASGAKPPSASDALKPAPAAKQVINWKHHGIGLTSPSVYSSIRERSPAVPDTKLEIIETKFARSQISASVPIRLFTDETGATLPRAETSDLQARPGPGLEYTAASRTTRLADIIIAWNVLGNFYPYFDVVKTDWNAVLPSALRRAAIDADEFAFEKTLQWTVAQLHDGHGNAFYTGAGKPAQMSAPFHVDSIEGKVIVTNVPDSTSGADAPQPGDEIVSINGHPAAAAVADLEQYISGATPQWIRAKSMGQFTLGVRDKEGRAEVRRFGEAGLTARTVTFKYSSMFKAPTDSRPANLITELKPGIWYVDLTRSSDQDFTAALPKLEKAQGIVFDLRGYPKVTPAWLAHVTDKPLKSAQWHIANSTRPGEHNFVQSGWPIEPKAPYLTARKVFLTDGGAISYAETTMGIIEHFRLGEILGSPTAGTNGNINTLTLPGKYRIIFTGMKVLKHDGTQHHGIGILPTIPVARTQAGVAAGKDEVLERAVAVLEQ